MVRHKRKIKKSILSLTPVCVLSGIFLLLSFVFVLKASSNSNAAIAKALKPFYLGGLLRKKNRVKSELDPIQGNTHHDYHRHIPSTIPKAGFMVEDKSTLPPITVEEVIEYLSGFLQELHELLIKCSNRSRPITYHKVWKIYHDLAIKTLFPWDLHYQTRMPKKREDGSIFLSIASYRDENCVTTIKGAYGMAQNPDKLFVGLVQQNCYHDCKTGMWKDGTVSDTEPDGDCYELFCNSPEGQDHCDAGRIRVLHMDESDSLGPYTARYFASKLWNGEQWYIQMDSHMTFALHWDTLSLSMLQDAPSNKPILSHYPPSDETDFRRARTTPAPRICGPNFASSPNEAQIIRLEGVGQYERVPGRPRFAPFVAAGYFVVQSDFLSQVPFDPFLPWIFMGEEIIMSARLWTAGYDIFSPSYCVVGHMYDHSRTSSRRGGGGAEQRMAAHPPKFWESLSRRFWRGIHNPLQMLVLHRIKNQLKYPESSRDFLKPASLLTGLSHYTMGTFRTVEDYLDLIGIDPIRKLQWSTEWCEAGQPPEYAQDKAYLYQ